MDDFNYAVPLVENIFPKIPKTFRIKKKQNTLKMGSLLKTKRRLTIEADFFESRVFTGRRCQWLQDLDVFAAVTKQT